MECQTNINLCVISRHKGIIILNCVANIISSQEKKGILTSFAISTKTGILSLKIMNLDSASAKSSERNKLKD